MTELLEPWNAIEEQRRQALEQELERELPSDHALAGKSVRAVAVRMDQDDVLFEVLGGGYAVVHLTWTGRRESSSQWPATRLFSSLQDWRERGMKPDHEELASGE
jgi:hypothetical protein